MAVSGRTMAPSNAFRSDANKGDGLAGQLGRRFALRKLRPTTAHEYVPLPALAALGVQTFCDCWQSRCTWNGLGLGL